MLDYLLKYCTNCSSLEEISCKLDGVLAQYGKNSLDNLSYMVNKPAPHSKIRELIYYKDILKNLRWNQSFYYPYTMPQILSRIGAILGGERVIQKRFILPSYTTTTTTSTTSTSSTTTSTTTA